MTSIILKNAGLAFPVYNTQSFSLTGKILRVATGGHIHQSSNKVRVVQALEGLSLEIESGDRVGLIGHNGAGKTTFLKMLAGIYTATEGSVEVSTTPTTLFDYNLGMDQEATGYENIIVSGLLRGLSYDKITGLASSIVEFSELGEFINMPMRTYSAGMRMRLGFSISTVIEPEILLMDEVFGAGDSSFFKKAQHRMEELMNKAKILVLATHSLELMKKFCNKALLLNHGRLADFGDIFSVLSKYEDKC